MCYLTQRPVAPQKYLAGYAGHADSYGECSRFILCELTHAQFAVYQTIDAIATEVVLREVSFRAVFQDKDYRFVVGRKRR